MAEIVGTAYVRIRAITTQLQKDIKDGVDRGAKNADADQAGEQLGFDFVDNFTGKLDDDLGPGMKRSMNEAADDAKPDTEKKGAGLGDTFAKNFREAFDRERKRSGGPFDFLRKTRIAWYVILGVPALAGAGKAIGAVIITLIAQLGFLATAAVGAGVALGAAFVPVLAAVGVAFAAFKTETETLEAFKEEMKGLGDAWKEVGERAQIGLLPALADAATLITDELTPALADFAEAMGTTLGNTVLLGAEVLTAARNQKALTSILNASTRIVRILGRGFVFLFDAFIPVLEAAMPLAEDLAEVFRDWAKGFRDVMRAAGESGQLSATLEVWWERAKLVGGALKNIWDALWNVLTIGGETAGTFFDTLSRLATDWETFTESPEGIEQIREMFERARPVMKAVNRLLRDIFDAILQPIIKGDNAGLVAFLEILRLNALPAIEALFDVLATPGMTEALGSLTTGLSDMIIAASDSGALTSFLDTLTGLLDWLGEVMSDPKWGPVLLNLIGLATAFSALNSALLGFPSGIVKGIGFALGNLAVGAIAAEFSALAGALGLSAGALLGWVAVIVAAVAGAIWVWKNWDKVKVWLGNAWRWIQDFAVKVGDWLSELPGKIVDWLSEAGPALWAWLQEAVPVALGKLQEFAAGILDWITQLPARIVEWIAGTSFVDAAAGLFGWLQPALEYFSGLLSAMGEFLSGFFQGVIAVISNVIETFLNLLDDFAGIITGVFDGVVRVISGFIDVITGLFTGDWEQVWEGAQDIFFGIWDAISAAITGLPGIILDIVSGLFDAAKDAGEAIVDGILDGLGAAGGAVWNFAQDIGRGFLDFVNDHIIAPIKNFQFTLSWNPPGPGPTFSHTFQPFGSLPYLAKGGIIQVPTVAVLGEAGAEAVIPLDRLSQMINHQGTGPSIALTVKIGERDITDIVDSRVSHSNALMARSIHTGHGGGR